MLKHASLWLDRVKRLTPLPPAGCGPGIRRAFARHRPFPPGGAGGGFATCFSSPSCACNALEAQTRMAPD